MPKVQRITPKDFDFEILDYRKICDFNRIMRIIIENNRIGEYTLFLETINFEKTVVLTDLFYYLLIGNYKDFLFRLIKSLHRFQTKVELYLEELLFETDEDIYKMCKFYYVIYNYVNDKPKILNSKFLESVKYFSDKIISKRTRDLINKILLLSSSITIEDDISDEENHSNDNYTG